MGEGLEGERNVSRRHAELRRDAAGAWWVRDVGSANGTFVNGERLDAAEARPLAPGDCVQLGDTLLTFRPAVLDAPLPSAFATSPGQPRPGADAPARLLLRQGLGCGAQNESRTRQTPTLPLPHSAPGSLAQRALELQSASTQQYLAQVSVQL
jgi:FHA domain